MAACDMGKWDGMVTRWDSTSMSSISTLVDEHVVDLDERVVRFGKRRYTLYANTVKTQAVLYRAFVARDSLYLYGA